MDIRRTHAKSAYPSVDRTRLLAVLEEARCPTYLLALVEGFLTGRLTVLRLHDFSSCEFSFGNGLPQGSPLLVILFLIYISNLLLPSRIHPSSSSMSIGFVDDISHLVAGKDVLSNVHRLEQIGHSSLEWGRR